MNRILDWALAPLVDRAIDVLEWLYDRDVKARNGKPFGG